MTDLSKPPRPDEIMRYLAAAIRERRYESVPHLLRQLMYKDSRKAEAVCAAMLAALPSRSPNATVAQGSLFDLEAS